MAARAIFGFEGTGSQEWGGTELRRSYVNKIVQQATGDHRFYYLGADNTGSNTQAVITKATSQASRMIDQHGVTEFIVAGYSRGGLMAVAFAQMLKFKEVHNEYQNKKGKITIPAMVLLDPVDRNAYKLQDAKGRNITTGDTIPNNVGFCIRAFRDPAYGSRLYMNNCALWAEKGPNIISAKFPASHSAMGGMPWDAAFFENGDVQAALASGDPAQAQNSLAGTMFCHRSALVRYDTPCSLNEASDKAGAYKVGSWVWKYLRDRSVVPESASFERNLAEIGDAIRTQ